MRRALLLLLLVGCELPQAITFPLPLGGSVVVDVWGPDECTPAHEEVHQRQIRELGAAVFLARRTWESLTLDEPRCGSIELPAYQATWACLAEVYPGPTAEEFREAQTWRCP